MKSLLALVFFLVFGIQIVSSKTIVVGDSGDYATLSAAEAFIEAGDTVILQAQVFSNGSQFLEGINGTAENPVVIMAEDLHQSIFRGGTEAIHLIDCSHVVISGIVVEQQTGNGINIDDGGDYSTPSRHITIRDCIFRDMAANGNNDLLKMSGVDSFLIEQCRFVNGGNGGSGVDFVGCHWGTVQDCYFDDPGTSGIQNKGGSHHIRIQRNVFKDVAQRALNLGGSTGLQYFRPPLADPIVDAFEAADLEVFSNVFIGCWAPIAYVGSVRVKVYNNTFYQPENWVIRILQETTTDGFLPCSDNEFRNNIIYIPDDLTEVNIGPNTAPETFSFSNNLWFNASSTSWVPNLPVEDVDQRIGDPLFEDVQSENFRIPPGSPAVEAGMILNAPTTDFDGMEYLIPPSAGAFEGGEEVNEAHDDLTKVEWSVYPNPVSEIIRIEGYFVDAQIRIVNSRGDMVGQYFNVSQKMEIDVSNLPAGVYHVLLENLDNGNWVVRPFIKR